MKSHHLIFITILITLLISSCNEEEEIVQPKEKEYSHNELFLHNGNSKVWTLVSAKANGEEWLPECLMDNTWTFKVSGSIVRKDGNLPCGNSIDETETGLWQLNKQETLIALFGGIYKILRLSETTLILEFRTEDEVFVDTYQALE